MVREISVCRYLETSNHSLIAYQEVIHIPHTHTHKHTHTYLFRSLKYLECGLTAWKVFENLHMNMNEDSSNKHENEGDAKVALCE